MSTRLASRRLGLSRAFCRDLRAPGVHRQRVFDTQPISAAVAIIPVNPPPIRELGTASGFDRELGRTAITAVPGVSIDWDRLVANVT
jgi:hypothetical protein